MAEMIIGGIDTYLELLMLTEKQTDRICGRSLYPGAKVIADECKKQIDALVVDNTLFAWNPMRKGITGGWKKALQQSMGIASMRKVQDGYNVKLGFDGYSDITENRSYTFDRKNTVYNSNKNPGHKIPNAVIAYTTNKGSSNLPAQPFMDRSIAISESKVLEAIDKQFDKEIEKIWGK